MGIYDTYADRSRVSAGVTLKRKQNRTIFDLGLRFASAPVSRILEIGPGDGYIAEYAIASGLRYAAIEGSSVVAQALRGKGIEVHVGYVPPLPDTLSEPFDCCFLLHVIEHMPSPTAAFALLEDIQQALVPGATVVIACPSFERWGSRFYDCDYTHTYPTTQRRLRLLLREADMEVVHETIYCGSFSGYRSLPASWFAKLVYPLSIDGLIGHRVPNDILHRGALTFMPSLLTIARSRT